MTITNAKNKTFHCHTSSKLDPKVVEKELVMIYADSLFSTKNIFTNTYINTWNGSVMQPDCVDLYLLSPI